MFGFVYVLPRLFHSNKTIFRARCQVQETWLDSGRKSKSYDIEKEICEVRRHINIYVWIAPKPPDHASIHFARTENGILFEDSLMYSVLTTTFVTFSSNGNRIHFFLSTTVKSFPTSENICLYEQNAHIIIIFPFSVWELVVAKNVVLMLQFGSFSLHLCLHTMYQKVWKGEHVEELHILCTFLPL